MKIQRKLLGIGLDFKYITELQITNCERDKKCLLNSPNYFHLFQRIMHPNLMSELFLFGV